MGRHYSAIKAVLVGDAADCNAKTLFQQIPGGADSASGAANVTFTTPGTIYVICPVGATLNNFPFVIVILSNARLSHVEIHRSTAEAMTLEN